MGRVILMEDFKAFVIDLIDGKTDMRVKTKSLDELAAGTVTIKVAYSSVNYKDGLATLPKQIIQSYP